METMYTPELIGELNQNLILEVVRSSGPLSRADICRRVSLSFPAVSANVKMLLEKGLLCECGAGNNTMGRKSTLLGFNAHYGYLVGLKLGRHNITEILCDLHGTPLSIRSGDIGRQFADLEQIRSCVVSTSQKLLAESGVPIEKILCVSVSLPGIIDQNSEYVHMAPYLPQLNRGDLIAAIKNVFGEIPILFENNVNNGALGEQWKGAGKGYQDIFYLHYDIGIGGALILHNELCKGSHQAAGEIGYMLIDPSSLRMEFQSEGATEKTLSGHAILSMLQADGSTQELDTWFDACDAGDPKAASQLELLIRRTGILLVNVTSTIDPQVIILSGRIGRRMFRHAKDTWIQILNAHVPYVPQIVCSEMRGMESLYGAVKVGLAYLSQHNFLT